MTVIAAMFKQVPLVGQQLSTSFEELRRKRGRRNAVVELAVEYAVPDIRDLVVRVSELGGGRPDETIWP